MSFLGLSLAKSVGTVLAGTGLLLGAATGVHALASDSPTPSASASSSTAPSCGKGVAKPQALREAAKKARALPAGPKRAAARAEIKKDVLAGKYGAALKERAEKAKEKRFAGLPTELREAMEKVQAKPEGRERSEAAKQLRSDVRAGKYGKEVRATAEARAKTRAEARKERSAATTPALTAARKKIAAMPKGDARQEAAKQLHTDVLAGKYGDAAKSYAEKRTTDRDQAREDLRAKVKEHRETCAKESSEKSEKED